MLTVKCSTGYSDGAGGAVLVRDGSLRVIDCYLAGNEAALIGPDVGGGAIYILGSNVSYIVQSTFVSNRASNAVSTVPKQSAANCDVHAV